MLKAVTAETVWWRSVVKNMYQRAAQQAATAEMVQMLYLK